MLLIAPGIGVAQELPQEYARLMQERAPDEFKALMAPRPMVAEFVLVNGNSIQLDAQLGNYEVRLDDAASIARFKEFLLVNNVSDGAAEQLATDLQIGKGSAPDCKGDKQRCQVQVADSFSVVVDAPAKRVRVMLAPDTYREDTGKPQYHAAYNSHPALINKMSLFRSRFNGELSSTFNDKMVLGLPYGHLRADLQGFVNNQERSLDVDNLEYNLDLAGFRMMAGRSRYFNNQNTTSLLNFSSQQKEGVYLMSSRNLMRGNSSSYQRTYFYMPQAGAVEAYRDGQLLFSRPVDAGQQYISYDQLPPGIYQLTLKLKSGDNVMTEQVVSINNNPSVTLPTGQMDYSVGVSRLRSNEQELPIAEGSVAFRPLDYLQLASGVILSDQEQLFSGAMSWSVNDTLRFDSAVGLFSDSARYVQSSLTWHNVTFGYQALTGSEGEPMQSRGQATPVDTRLSTMLFGQSNDYQQASLSTSYQWGSLSAYASLFLYEMTPDESGSAQTVSANAGLSMPFYANSTLGVNLGISDNVTMASAGDKSGYKDVTLGVNWSMPLGERTQMIANVQGSRNGTGNAYSTVRHQFAQMGNFSTSLEAGARYNGMRTEATASGSFNYRGSAFQTTGNGTLSENNNNLFLSLEGSQILSSEGLHFTVDESESYLMVRDSGTLDKQSQPVSQSGLLVMGNERDFSTAKGFQAAGDTQVTPLGNYQYHTVKVQGDNGLIHNRGDQDIRGFAFPGTLLTMETRFEREYQLLGAFYLPDGSPASDLTCDGEACMQVEKLDEGLFKIRLSGDGGYQLVSGRYQCLDDRKVDTEQNLTRLARIDCTAPSRDRDGPSMLAGTPR
ncbi:TcfC E-set like domain-containing protein [Aeromonas sp. SG16]|uniref:TcfC E-set like domain-containing protein n=1 Tax=Aeromonas sp. SG16 TaxID=2950548 RepID=UPI002108C8CC|nr:TcfC E-set like domain-containing protein [Aeromonas sp. SG16]MCQ4054431.1 TcfC E-set like domain-containing protein [Aeromonas sp. SG16]